MGECSKRRSVQLRRRQNQPATKAEIYEFLEKRIGITSETGALWLVGELDTGEAVKKKAENQNNIKKTRTQA